MGQILVPQIMKNKYLSLLIALIAIFFIHGTASAIEKTAAGSAVLEKPQFEVDQRVAKLEKFLESLIEAEKIIQIVDHIIYMTFPLIKDKNLLLKTLSETKTVVTKCINSILQYEYLHKRITLYKESKSNFRIFREKCAQRYKITEKEIKLILELFELAKKHKKSPMEFVRKEKIVILSENSEPDIFTLEKSKEFLILAKNILEKTKKTMEEDF